MPDTDIELAQAIKVTHEEINTAREVVRNLANELADVIDVIEPALTSHTNRIRQARMASIEEMRQVTLGIRELKQVIWQTPPIKCWRRRNGLLRSAVS